MVSILDTEERHQLRLSRFGSKLVQSTGVLVLMLHVIAETWNCFRPGKYRKVLFHASVITVDQKLHIFRFFFQLKKGIRLSTCTGSSLLGPHWICYILCQLFIMYVFYMSNSWNNFHLHFISSRCWAQPEVVYWPVRELKIHNTQELYNTIYIKIKYYTTGNG